MNEKAANEATLSDTANRLHYIAHQIGYDYPGIARRLRCDADILNAILRGDEAVSRLIFPIPK